MKKVIVSGANGFVGAALCKALTDQGIGVIAILKNCQADSSNIEHLPGLRIVYCDLCDFGKLDTIIDERDIEIFYHLAWVGSAGPLRGDYNIQIKNVQYACDSVMACHKMGIKKFVFASSIMEYEIEAVMKGESTPGINNLYSSAKVASDYMVRIISGSCGIDYIRAVISNIYGPGETSPRLINTSLRKLLNHEHCAFSTGEQIYDFIYITDAAQAFVEIGEKGKANRTYYIGSLSPRPLKEFLCEMRDQVDPDIVIGLGEIPFHGISLSYQEFDLKAIYRDTGFVPKVSFKEGIRKTIEWIKG